MATVKQNLIAAKALIAEPVHWSKDGGNGVDCFCAATACEVFPHDDHYAFFDALTDALPSAWKVPGAGVLAIFRFNDAPATTHADIMALFDRAIAAQHEAAE